MTKLKTNNVKFTRSVGTTSVQPTFIPYSIAELTRTIQNPNSFSTATSDYFGQGGGAISIDPVTGSYFAVGTPNERYNGTGLQTGLVHIFDAETGNLLISIDSPYFANGAAFGHSLDIRDNTLLVGAYGVDTPATNSGVVYLYQLS